LYKRLLSFPADFIVMLHGWLAKPSLKWPLANICSNSLQEMGDLTSLIEVLKIMKFQKYTHGWSYSEREGKQLLKRLEDAVHESIKRAQQHQSDRCWGAAEYLWRSIRMYGSAHRLEQIKEIRLARTEAKSQAQKFSNPPLVVLHEQIGDYPAAE
jgi:hypothetical protein